MCIVFLAISDNPIHDGYKVIIGVNRDEYTSRPTKELHWWEKRPDIISGIDLFPGKEGGTWLGMSKSGKVGILTNYRQSPKFKREDEIGRGQLVSDFLKSEEKPKTFLENVEENGHKYGGFNLILGEVIPGKTEMNFSYYCNKESRPLQDLTPGIYGLSNRYLDYGWKKVDLGKKQFEKIVKEESSMQEKVDKVLELLLDETRYGVDDAFRGPEDEGLPDMFLERLSAISVKIPEMNYCSRTHSVITVDHEDNVTFLERTMIEPMSVKNPCWTKNNFEFKIEPNYHS
ncbi:transport and Golgi organization 2 homolog [Dendronephthya gigantea]|uniref:transport and Golgi organization 2 homolog n=1 Tax=Dendronephthya gigantea TaxID=151771 RepID=UPI0010698F9B|nr:transport and Golgi organization 2 homolog [Dendronephthya gigantea]